MGHPMKLYLLACSIKMCTHFKSELVAMLGSATSTLKDIPINPINTVIINDVMAFVQGINVNNLKKLNDLAKLYVSVLMKQFIVADTIIAVFDRYTFDFSVKTCRAGPIRSR